MLNKIVVSFFTILLLSFSNSVFADDSCGLKPIDLSAEEMERRGLDDGSGMIPDERNYDICSEDVAYKTYYLLFQEAIEQPIVSNIFDAFTNLSDDFKVKAQIMDIAAPAMTAVYAFTWVVFIFVAISFAISGLTTISRGAMKGEFFGREFNGFKPFFSLALGMIAVFPVGVFTLGQLSIIIAGLFALAMGNLVYSAFLYSTGVKSAEITVPDSIIYNSAESQSIDMILSTLMADRTKRAIASYNLKSYAEAGYLDSFQGVVSVVTDPGQELLGDASGGFQYLTDKFIDVAEYVGADNHPATFLASVLSDGAGALKSSIGGESSQLEFNDDDLNFVNGHINYCVGSAWYVTQTGNYTDYAEINSLSLENKRRCFDPDGNFIANRLNHDEDIHGYSYSSGSIYYGQNKLFGSAFEKSVLTQTKDTQDTTVGEVIVAAIEDSSDIIGNFSSVSKYEDIMNKIKPIAMKNTPIPTEELNNSIVPALKEEISDQIRQKYSAFKNNFDSKLSEGEKAKMQGIYLYALHYTVLKSLAGGYLPDGYEDKILLNENYTDTIMGTMINKEAVVAAKKIQTAYCLPKVSKLGESNLLRKKALNEKYKSTSEDDAEEFMDEAVKINGLFECIDTNIVKGSNGVIDFIEPNRNNVFNLVFGENNKINPDASTKLEEESNALMDLVKKEHIYPLTMYIYTIKKATAESLSDMIKNETDKEMVNSLRQRGWLSFASYLLEISQIQSMSSNYIEEIISFFTVSSTKTGNSITGNYHVNINAFFQDSATEEEKEFPAQISDFSVMNLNNFWLNASNMGESNTNFYMGKNDQMAKQTAFDKIMDSLKEVALTPTDPLRQMVGAEKGESLGERLENCVDTAEDCIPQVHPLNSITSFGHEMIGVAVTFKIVHFVVDGLMSMIDETIDVLAASISGGNSTTKKALGFLGNLGGAVIKGILILVHAVTGVLNSVASVLLIAGIFLGYIVPLIPFIAMLVAFMGWIVSILVGLLVIVVWPAVWAMPKNENNEGRVNFKTLWALYGQILLKPAILVIALAFAWVLSNVVIFTLSILISVVFASIETSSSGIISWMFDQFLFYITLTVLIFITLSYSFKIVNKLTDEFFKKTGIDQSSDQQLMDSLGFERAVQAMAVADVAERTLETPQRIRKNSQRLREIRKKRQKEKEEKNS